METITLSRKERHRPGLLTACAGRITNRQVAEVLGLSLRQVRRLRRRFETGGARALAHRSCGRPSRGAWPTP
jgi:transposase